MSRAAFDNLRAELETAYAIHPSLQAFQAFPDDLRAQEVAPFHVPAADLFKAETFALTGSDGLSQAILSASEYAHWRETYKGAGIGEDFMARFGCYCLIGENAPFWSDSLRAFMVYMPAGLWYPWHQHPAEELYLCLAGEAVFYREGDAPEIMRPGEKSFHASDQPHATMTMHHPFLALVLWRNHFDVPPVLTDITKRSSSAALV